MRILTVVRQVLDAEASVKVNDGKVDLAASKLVVDTMDEYGVEQALRTALAMGADRAILVESADALDVLAVSSVVAQIARREAIDLVFCGGQQADWDSHALGAATAERLGWPQATWTNSLALDGQQLVGTHDVDAGSESFRLSLPAVVTTQQGLNEPRYPTLPNIMKAKRKELRRDGIEAFAVTSRLKVLHAGIQTKERRRKVLDGKDANAAAAQLVDLLRNEARVI